MRYSYAVQVVREDGTEVGQVPVRIDWEPAREWVRLKALERGVPPDEAFLLDCGFSPVWDSNRGQPWIGGFDGGAAGQDGGPREIFAVGYFGELARGVTKRLVAEGTLQKGDLIRCHPLAYPELGENAPTHAPEPERLGRVSPPRIAVRPRPLRELLAVNGSEPVAAEEPIPVFIPERVLDEAGQLTTAEQGERETGGVLIGHLFRDGDEARLFAEVTAQVPARYTEASSAKLTFTPATWTEVRAAISLRNRAEMMLGWWHSHPVREWCKDCPPEKQASCALAQGFLSEDDRLLHRTVFPRAYSVALVVNDIGEGGPTYSLFGWSRGVIEERSFHRLGKESDARTQ